MIVTALNASMKMMIWREKECQQIPPVQCHPIEKYMRVLTPDMALVAAKERVAL